MGKQAYTFSIVDYDEASWSKFVATPEGSTALEAAAWALDGVEEWTVRSIETALRDMLDKTGLGVRAGLQPIRVAIYGSAISPAVFGPLFESIDGLGKAETLERIESALTRLNQTAAETMLQQVRGQQAEFLIKYVDGPLGGQTHEHIKLQPSIQTIPYMTPEYGMDYCIYTRITTHETPELYMFYGLASQRKWEAGPTDTQAPGQPRKFGVPHPGRETEQVSYKQDKETQ